MRILSALTATAAAVLLAGTLASCSMSSPGGVDGPASVASSPAPTSGTALDLVGTVWHVAGRGGTTVRFDGASVTVVQGGGAARFAWSAQGDEVLIGAGASSIGAAVGVPWLTATTRVARTAGGWSLLDASGAATAHLTPDGTAAATTATTLLTAGKPGSGVVDRPASAIAGRWTAVGDAAAAITLTDGAWTATSSCRSGAIGGQGVYRVLPGGRLLVARTRTLLRGCPIRADTLGGPADAITGIARAASFRVRGGTLTLFDRSGASLGSLVRG